MPLPSPNAEYGETETVGKLGEMVERLMRWMRCRIEGLGVAGYLAEVREHNVGEMKILKFQCSIWRLRQSFCGHLRCNLTCSHNAPTNALPGRRKAPHQRLKSACDRVLVPQPTHHHSYEVLRRGDAGLGIIARARLNHAKQ